MPCIDAETSRKWDEYNHNEDYKRKQHVKLVSKTVDKVNFLTKILCEISQLPLDTPVKNISKLVPNYSVFILQHREEDKERWYQKYKQIYPAFSKDEIVKMVQENILDK